MWSSSAHGLDLSPSSHPFRHSHPHAEPGLAKTQFMQGAHPHHFTLLHHHFLRRWKRLPVGSAGPGTQGNIPSCCWEQQNALSFHRTHDFTQISFAVCSSKERGLPVGDGSTAEVTSALLALPQPRDKRFLLFTSQTVVNIYCIALNALLKTFTHIYCLPKSKLI